MRATVAVLIITLVSLLAWIAQLKHNRVAAISLVVLVGVLVGNAPGLVGVSGQWLADFLFIDVPNFVRDLVNEG
ncbi:hypothetical protein E1193_13530 [Micromonospora sp. KC606]|uniref:hypothetical protein n=1 Tax=Micromonospora sp. KC606 TaxID=2530379 RepID=UPI0010529EC2|nr:hypothetical protein [Micromonospora sp. KC606]TDC81918.1 hypothetical protein E1193_13530 [Micromonospora sp. KC606]